MKRKGVNEKKADWRGKLKKGTGNLRRKKQEVEVDVESSEEKE